MIILFPYLKWATPDLLLAVAGNGSHYAHSYVTDKDRDWDLRDWYPDTSKKGVALPGLITGERVCHCLPKQRLCQSNQPRAAEGWAWKATSD